MNFCCRGKYVFLLIRQRQVVHCKSEPIGQKVLTSRNVAMYGGCQNSFPTVDVIQITVQTTQLGNRSSSTLLKVGIAFYFSTRFSPVRRYIYQKVAVYQKSFEFGGRSDVITVQSCLFYCFSCPFTYHSFYNK